MHLTLCSLSLQAPLMVGGIFRTSGESYTPTLGITWTKPDGQCPAEAYSVKYKLFNKDKCEIVSGKTFTQNVSGIHAEISGLEPNSQYVVNVTAMNSAGSGPDQSDVVTSGESGKLPTKKLDSLVW